MGTNSQGIGSSNSQGMGTSNSNDFGKGTNNISGSDKGFPINYYKEVQVGDEEEGEDNNQEEKGIFKARKKGTKNPFAKNLLNDNNDDKDDKYGQETSKSGTRKQKDKKKKPAKPIISTKQYKGHIDSVARLREYQDFWKNSEKNNRKKRGKSGKPSSTGSKWKQINDEDIKKMKMKEKEAKMNLFMPPNLCTIPIPHYYCIRDEHAPTRFAKKSNQN